MPPQPIYFFFFFNDTATTEIYTLSLHDALPIFASASARSKCGRPTTTARSMSREERSRPRARGVHALVLELPAGGQDRGGGGGVRHRRGGGDPGAAVPDAWPAGGACAGRQEGSGDGSPRPLHIAGPAELARGQH